MTPELSVSIVSYNTCDLLRQCLTTLAARQAEVSMDITVADNGSRDGSPEMVEAEFPHVRVIRTGGNLGFGRANNIALEHADGAYFCVLNSDAEPEPGALALLVAFMDAHPSIGLVGGQLVWPDGRPQTSWGDDPRLSGIWGEQTFFSALTGRLPCPRLPDFGGAKSVDQICGACFLVRPEAWRAAGGFDPAYFMYNEDVDLNVRLRRAGWGVAFLPEARIRHHLGASSAGDWQTRARMVASYNASRVYYFSRFFGPAAGVWVKRLCVLGASIRLLGWTLLALVRPAAKDKVKLFQDVRQRTQAVLPKGQIP